MWNNFFEVSTTAELHTWYRLAAKLLSIDMIPSSSVPNGDIRY